MMWHKNRQAFTSFFHAKDKLHFYYKRDFNEICAMFLGWEKEGIIIYQYAHKNFLCPISYDKIALSF